MALRVCVCSRNWAVHIRHALYRYSSQKQTFIYTTAMSALCSLIIRRRRLPPASYLNLFFVSGMVSAPAKKSTEIPNTKIASMFGRSAGAGENNETKVGIIPPIANPMFHDRPVPSSAAPSGSAR